MLVYNEGPKMTKRFHGSFHGRGMIVVHGTMVRVGARVGPGGLPTCGEWIRASGQLLVSAAHVFVCIVGARARGCPGALEGEADQCVCAQRA